MNIFVFIWIEVFDNLNIMGINFVFVMVVFIDGWLVKNEYWKYKIKIV